ncbi:unnamed protein product [Cylicocyclus nassatus]|uniref:Uncharacterized protein n=1 Tax=Cylicocyclus nassatus TaxID=53992 RepID=A0AA36HDS0_CYLNA|nr:unnamed protein product [Cylicocyclus nassatus]
MCTKQYAPSMRSLIVVSYLSTLVAAQDLAQGTAAEKLLKCQNGRWTGREMTTRRELTINRAFCKRYELDEHGCVGSASQSGRSQTQGDTTYCSPGDTECERKKKQSQCDVMFAPTFIYMKDMKLGDAKDLEDIVKLANDNNQISKFDMGQFGNILGTLLPNVHPSSTSSTSNTQPTLPPLPRH